MFSLTHTTRPRLWTQKGRNPITVSIFILFFQHFTSLLTPSILNNLNSPNILKHVIFQNNRSNPVKITGFQELECYEYVKTMLDSQCNPTGDTTWYTWIKKNLNCLSWIHSSFEHRPPCNIPVYPCGYMRVQTAYFKQCEFIC